MSIRKLIVSYANMSRLVINQYVYDEILKRVQVPGYTIGIKNVDNNKSIPCGSRSKTNSKHRKESRKDLRR